MRKLLFLLSFFVLGSSSYAQVSSNSPYSAFGLGEQGGLDHAAISGIGNSFGTAIDSFTLNYYNPASYNSLSKGNPLFSMGISTRLSNYTDGNNTNFSTVSAIQHFAFGFSLKKHFGLAFGLKPYSRRGYNVSTYNVVGSDSLKYTYSGKGGINELFLGLSTDLMRFDSTRLSVGANFGYLFGSLENQRSSTLVSSGANLTGGVDIRTIRAKSFHYDLGMYLSHHFNRSNQLLISAVIDPGQNLSTTYSYGRYYSTNVENTNIYDTLEYSAPASNRLTTIPRFTYGLRYTLSRHSDKDMGRRLNSALNVHLSYSTANYSKFSLPFDTSGLTYLNTAKYTLGLEYIPETGFVSNRSITKFHERMRYRIGGYYMTLPYQTDGEQVTDFGTTFGLGLPIVIKNSLSSVNFGFTVGKRGVTNEQSIGETYYGINFGITISPIGDNWFQKRKLN